MGTMKKDPIIVALKTVAQLSLKLLRDAKRIREKASK